MPAAACCTASAFPPACVHSARAVGSFDVKLPNMGDVSELQASAGDGWKVEKSRKGSIPVWVLQLPWWTWNLIGHVHRTAELLSRFPGGMCWLLRTYNTGGIATGIFPGCKVKNRAGEYWAHSFLGLLVLLLPARWLAASLTPRLDSVGSPMAVGLPGFHVGFSACMRGHQVSGDPAAVAKMVDAAQSGSLLDGQMTLKLKIIW